RPQLLATTTSTTVKAQTLHSPAKIHEVKWLFKYLIVFERLFHLNVGLVGARQVLSSFNGCTMAEFLSSRNVVISECERKCDFSTVLIHCFCVVDTANIQFKFTQRRTKEKWSTYIITEPQKPCFVRSRQRSLVGFEEKVIIGLEKHCTLNGGNLHLNDVRLRGCSLLCDVHSSTRKTRPSYTCFLSLCKNSVSGKKKAKICKFRYQLNRNSFNKFMAYNICFTEQCKVECLKRTVSGGPPCGALNWIPHIQSCMLFEVGYDKRLIMPSSHGQFLVNKCAGNVEPRSRYSYLIVLLVPFFTNVSLS
ncbi:unnamed protein product, partial [Haemonchus placei]|uniref:Apple domain-containing protein n=1 Tax=Haemonchus placei TaxID=6290 RepID=A0A0N4WTH8_HAEPC